MSDETAMLREYADALDADRGHNASAVTRRIREAADHLDALRADREERQQELESLRESALALIAIAPVIGYMPAATHRQQWEMALDDLCQAVGIEPRAAGEHRSQWVDTLRSAKTRAADAEAQLRAAEALLEERQQELRENERLLETAWRQRDDETENAKRAEADREALREALEEIVRASTALPHSSRIDRDNMQDVARQALAHLSSANQEEKP